MTDVSPKLLEQIKDSFESKYKKSSIIENLQEKVDSGSATYGEVNDFAIEIGELLAKAFQENLSEAVLPDGKMYFNIAKAVVEPMMKNNYDIVSRVAGEVQTALNASSKIGIKAIKPNLNQDRIDGIINRLSSEEHFDEVKWILDEPVVNFTQSIVDDAIKANAEFQYEAGLTPKIIRTVAGNCCKWCRSLAGKYSYPDVPQDIYRRHQRCRCTVNYHPGDGKVQNIHTKEWKRLSQHAKIKERSKIGYSSETNQDKIEYRKKVGINNLSYDESKALTNYVSSDAYIINDKLRNDVELTVDEEKFCVDLDNGLRKLPTYSGHLSRSLYFYSRENAIEFVDLFKEEKIISFNEYLSTTKGTRLYNPEGHVQIYIQNSQNGRDLGVFNQEEMEVLYERGAKFKVKKKQDVEGVWYILLEED